MNSRRPMREVAESTLILEDMSCPGRADET